MLLTTALHKGFFLHVFLESAQQSLHNVILITSFTTGEAFTTPMRQSPVAEHFFRQWIRPIGLGFKAYVWCKKSE